VWNWLALNTNPTARFTLAQGQMLRDASVKACAVKTGGVPGDAFITDPRGCDFDPGALQCTSATQTDCLNAEQVAGARKILDGVRTPSGALIFPGMPRGTEDSFFGAGVLHEPFMAALIKWVFGPTWTAAGYDFDGNTDVVNSVLRGIVNANEPSLDAFQVRGGKVLRYHGWYDGAIPPQDSINAYKATIAYEAQQRGAKSALQRTQEYYRLFMVPGLGHCDGGPGPSALGHRDSGVSNPLAADASGNAMIALQQWVEGGIAPQRVIGTNAETGMTRPICAYPKVARYNGTGPTHLASSFTCELSPYDAPQYNVAPDPKYLR
jgi:hypothetical protein